MIGEYKDNTWIVVTFILSLSWPNQAMDVKPQSENYLPNYKYYHNLTSLEKELKTLSNKFSKWMKLDMNYRSRNDRPQFLVHITDFNALSSETQNTDNEQQEKLKILFSFGEHAREFLPTESMLYLIKNITSGISGTLEDGSVEPFTKKVLTNIDLYIIAMANPDGRKYVELSQNYCWRGTSTGVDLERNFDWEYGGKGSSDNKGDEEFRGKHAFSEPESNIYTEITSLVQFDAFISFHSGINQIYIPFADSRSQKTKKKPENIEAMEDLAFHLSKATKYKYKYGNILQLSKYTADGTIFDYMAGVKKIPFSYTIELWGVQHKGPSCFDLFNPRSEDLQTVLKEIHPLYVELFSYLIKWKSSTVWSHSKETMNLSSLGYFIIIVLILFCLVAVTKGRLFSCVKFYQRRRIVSLRSLSSTFSLSLHKNI